VLFVSSLDPCKGVRFADRLLVTALARARNTGMTYSRNGRQLDRVGKAPIRLEGVRADIVIGRKGPKPRVFALDVAGRRRTRELRVAQTAAGWRFSLDGGRFRTVYYEVDWGR
jgi:hypothetical protein